VAAAKVGDEELLARIGDVFRRYGYEGASLRELSAASGLEKASLYHRFPGGKEEMALAIVARAGEWLEANVFAPLRDLPAAQRVPRAAGKLREFYRNGELWCTLDVLTLSGSSDAIRAAVRGSYQAWVGAFARAAREAGLPAPEARARAQQAIIEIEGSLVISRVTGDPKIFLRVLQSLPARLTRV